MVFWSYNGTFGIAIGLLCATASISIIYTLEGIYKAALYEHALGEKPLEFEEQDLRTAYRANSAMVCFGKSLMRKRFIGISVFLDNILSIISFPMAGPRRIP